MVKFGVYRLDQFRALNSRSAGSMWAFLTRGRTSLQLLGADVALAEKVELFERIMPGAVQLSSGVWRTTFRARFLQLDEYLKDILLRHFDASSALDVHDWAASDCSTSAEWFASLSAAFPKVRLTASDLTLFLLEATVPGGAVYILEPAGAALQYISPPFVIRLSPPERRLLVVNWLLCKRALRKASDLWKQWAIPAEWLEPDRGALDRPPFRFRKISLIHPEAEALRQGSERFAVRKHSAFDALSEPCDAIRTMNIFNSSYFDEPRLREGARAVFRSLRPGGIWIVGRTWQDHPPLHRVSVFQKQARGFKLVDRYEEGSEIDDLVIRAEF